MNANQNSYNVGGVTGSGYQWRDLFLKPYGKLWQNLRGDFNMIDYDCVSKENLVIHRSLSDRLGEQRFVPTEFLVGLLPEALLDKYTFWQTLSSSSSSTNSSMSNTVNLWAHDVLLTGNLKAYNPNDAAAEKPTRIMITIDATTKRATIERKWLVKWTSGSRMSTHQIEWDQWTGGGNN